MVGLERAAAAIRFTRRRSFRAVVHLDWLSRCLRCDPLSVNYHRDEYKSKLAMTMGGKAGRLIRTCLRCPRSRRHPARHRRHSCRSRALARAMVMQWGYVRQRSAISTMPKRMSSIRAPTAPILGVGKEHSEETAKSH